MEHQIEVSEALISLLKSKHIYVQRDLNYNRFTGFVRFDDSLEIEAYSQICYSRGRLWSMGTSSYSYGSSLPYSTQVGRFCDLSSNISVFPYGRHDPHRFTMSPIGLSNYSERGIVPMQRGIEPNGGFIPAPFVEQRPPIVIGHDVWIGDDVRIRPGIHIGNGAYIGTGAIITKDVPAYSMVAGNPATVHKKRFSDDVIDQLQKLEWWNYPYWNFKNIHGDEPIWSFIGKMYDLIHSGKIQKHQPEKLTAKDLLQFVE
ncbi:CatB-related O-acetyltransferase [Lactovum odontotermitis]